MLMSTLRMVAVIMGTTAIAWAADDPLGACPRIPQDRGNRANGTGT